MEVVAQEINSAWVMGCKKFTSHAFRTTSRHGEMCRIRGLFTTVYKDPTCRVLFDPLRDCNPFFHLMEAVWMLAGRNDVAMISRYNSNIHEYSDNGIVFHGAYGYRWRNYFRVDQIEKVVAMLTRNKYDRRAVIQMWHPEFDLDAAERGGKDVPCNLSISFHVAEGMRRQELDMTVFNRSNDLVWGAYGSNVVHFSILQELIACAIGISVGYYTQTSANTHVYEKHWDLVNKVALTEEDDVPYGNSNPMPLGVGIHNWRTILYDAEEFCDEGVLGGEMGSYRTAFFKRVVVPMALSYVHYKNKNFDAAVSALDPNIDFHEAGIQWINRRRQK